VSGPLIGHLLPGLYFLALGAGLAAVLGRWYDPLPRWAAALFLALPLALFWQALAAGRILLPLDVLRAYVPFRQLPPDPAGAIFLQRDLVHQIAPWVMEVKRALLAGRWPLWNRHAGAGMPLMADPQSQPFQPLVLLGYPFSVVRAAAVTAALRVHLALVFTFLLLRRQGLGGAPALAGSLAFALGSFVLLWLGWPIANAAALLPVALYAAARCDQRGAGRDFALLAGAVAALLLAGHPETMLYALALVGLFLGSQIAARYAGLGRLLLARAGVGRRPANRVSAGLVADRRPVTAPSGDLAAARRHLLRVGVALAVAAGIAAPPLLLAHAYLPTTARAEQVRWQLARRPLAELWDDLGRRDVLAAWGLRAGSRLLLTAAPRALGDEGPGYRGDTNYFEDASGFAGTATLLAALLAVPAAAGAPLAAGGRPGRLPQERLMLLVLAASLLLLGQPPGLDNLVGRLPIAGWTAVHGNGRMQLLVGFCLAYLAACQLERWTRGARPRPLAVAAAALGLAGVLAWGYLGHFPAGLGWGQDSQCLAWLWAQAAVLAAAAMALAVPAWRARGRRLPAWPVWMFCALVGGELLAANGGANRASPERLAFPVTPPVDFLMRHLGSGRMVGMAKSFPANFPAFYGLDDVRIDNPSVPDAYQRVTAGLSPPHALEPFFGRPGHPLYDFLGVRYVVTHPGAALSLPAAFKDAAGWVFERPRRLPRLFLPERIQVDQGQWAQGWLENNDDFARRALVSIPSLVGRHWRARQPGESQVAVGAVAAERIRGHASLVELRLLAASIYQDGDWHVLAGGRPVAGTLVNGVFAGAWLPAGEWDVELIYRPPRLLAGCLLTALAVVLACAWWVPVPTCRGWRPSEPRPIRPGGGPVLSWNRDGHETCSSVHSLQSLQASPAADSPRSA
jgi:hypothetical protein